MAASSVGRKPLCLCKKQGTGEGRARRWGDVTGMGRAGAGGPTSQGPGSPLVHNGPHLPSLPLLGVFAGAGDARFLRAFSHFHLGVIGPDVKHVCRDKCASNHSFLPPE